MTRRYWLPCLLRMILNTIVRTAENWSVETAYTVHTVVQNWSEIET